MYKLKVALVVLFGLLTFISCDKEDDKDSPAWTYYRVYKTKGDYFNFANTWVSSNSGPTVLNIGDSVRVSTLNGDTVYALRWNLHNGYILGMEISDNDYFTDVTFKEIIKYNEINNCECFSNKELWDRIIDKDPFIEFYYLDDDDGFFDNYHRDMEYFIDTINKIIDKKMLEDIFTRIK